MGPLKPPTRQLCRRRQRISQHQWCIPRHKQNLGGLSNGDTGTFTLSSVVYDFSVAVGSGTATISFTGDSGAELSTAEAEALLDSLRYNNSSDNPTASSDRVLSINAFDGAAQTSNTATSTITVAAANDAPTLDLDPGQASNNYSFTFTEGDSATAITVASGTSLADVDSSSFDKVTVAFSQANFADGASESLNINGASLGGTISNLGGLSNGDTGTFTLSSVVYDFSVAVGSGTATISFTGDSGAELSTAEAEALLDSLRYNNSSDNPTASSDRVLSINAFDGAAQTSNTATSTITVAAANDAPTLDLDPGQASNNYSFTFTEGDSATAITVASGTSLADVDSSSFDKVTVAFSQANFADGASESLNINGASLGGTISNLGGLSNGDTGTFTLSSVVYDFSVAVGSGTATISFTGDSGAELSTAEAEALLDSLRYNNSSDNPTASSDRVLSINAFDGAAQTSNTATSTITVAAANDAPTLDLDPGQASNNYSFTFTEGDSATAITVASGTSLADVDSSSFDKVTVAFSQANFADGASEPLNINGASLGGTISNLGGLSNGDTGTFTLSSVVYDFSVAVGSGTATISFTGDSGAELSTAEAEALLDSLRYNNIPQTIPLHPATAFSPFTEGDSTPSMGPLDKPPTQPHPPSPSLPQTTLPLSISTQDNSSGLQQLLLHIHRRRFRNGHHRRLGNLTR